MHPNAAPQRLYRNRADYLLNGNGNQPAPAYLLTPAMHATAIAQHAIDHNLQHPPAYVHPPPINPMAHGPAPYLGPHALDGPPVHGLAPVHNPPPGRGPFLVPPVLPAGALYRMESAPPPALPQPQANVYPAALGEREGMLLLRFSLTTF
jgi:hypothetical protein